MSETIPAGTFARPVRAELARVLAQAADSAYAPSTLYVVARYDPAEPGTTINPYNVQKPVATPDEAQELVDDLKEHDPDFTYGIFGPFLNSGGSPSPEQATVAQLLVTPQGGLEPQEPFVIPGQQFDALFYSTQAVEKFVVPYCVQEYGPLFGYQVLEAFREAPLALMGHLPWSEETRVVDAGAGAPRQDAAAGVVAEPAGKTRYVPVLLKGGADGKAEHRVLRPPAPGGA